MPSVTSAPFHALSAPVKAASHLAVSAAKAVGNFLYGDEIRTKRSITFSYLCVAVYLLAVINAESLSTCVR